MLVGEFLVSGTSAQAMATSWWSGAGRSGPAYEEDADQLQCRVARTGPRRARPGQATTIDTHNLLTVDRNGPLRAIPIHASHRIIQKPKRRGVAFHRSVQQHSFNLASDDARALAIAIARPVAGHSLLKITHTPRPTFTGEVGITEISTGFVLSLNLPSKRKRIQTE